MKKLLIYVVAYNHENFIKSTISRILEVRNNTFNELNFLENQLKKTN